jgi:aryl-alcohol dehydrogenase-like predicted oxidoreductase
MELILVDYRTLGRSGLQVSVVGVGGNQFGGKVDAAGTAAILDAAFEAGINTVDTADVYSNGRSEEFVGRAIAERRQDWVLMTKFAMSLTRDGRPNTAGGSRGYLRKALEASLKRLGTDYIDVYQVHQFDLFTPVEETMAALDEVVRAGMVRYIGCSNYPAWRIAQSNEAAHRAHGVPFISSQPKYNVLDRSVELEHIPACEAYGLGLIPWSPLAGGFLSGKYHAGETLPEGTRLAASEWARRSITDESWTQMEALRAVGDERDLTMTQLAVGWLIAQPVVRTVIIGATSPDQVRENAAAAVTLDFDTVHAINVATGHAH